LNSEKLGLVMAKYSSSEIMKAIRTLDQKELAKLDQDYKGYLSDLRTGRVKLPRRQKQ